MSSIRLVPVAQLANTLQNYELINRGILDTAGAAVPVISWARTSQERREKILDRVIVIGSSFFLAPIHAGLMMHVSARTKRIPISMMRINYTQLKTLSEFKTALKTLSKAKTTFRITENLRKRVVQAKVNMLMPDLILECLLMGGVGWITNMFSRMQTGRNRFSGEQNATSQENLNKLYKIESSYQKNEKWRLLGTLALSIGMPLTLGFLLKKSLASQRGPASNLLKAIRNKAHYFDYKNGIWMSMPSLGIVVTAQFFGHLFSARNMRELRENAIRETMMNAIFFWGDYIWRKILAKLSYRSLKFPSAETSMQKIRAMRLPVKLKTRWLNTVGRQSIAALILNSATLAGAIILNNYLTQKKVEADVKTKLRA